MGRIALFDGHARKFVGDREALETFDQFILGPLQRDLIANTWMHERYTCDGQQMENRTAMYFEYPCTVAMLLREVRYGISIGFFNVTIQPFRSSEEEVSAPFHYHVRQYCAFNFVLMHGICILVQTALHATHNCFELILLDLIVCNRFGTYISLAHQDWQC